MKKKTNSPEPTAPDPQSEAHHEDSGAILTEAQRSFIRLLGRLLARRWREEQRGRHKPALREGEP